MIKKVKKFYTFVQRVIPIFHFEICLRQFQHFPANIELNNFEKQNMKKIKLT